MLCTCAHTILIFGQTNLPFSFYFWKMVKIIKKINKIVWFCKFWYGINSWDLKILYKNLESWKNGLKKNGMEWFVGLESWIVWNSMK